VGPGPSGCCAPTLPVFPVAPKTANIDWLGIQRKVAVAVPHFLAAPHIIAASDLLLTVAERVAEVVAGPLDLAVLAPPRELELTGFTMSILWHDRTHDDPARRWLRDVIVAEASKRSRTPPAVATRSQTPPFSPLPGNPRRARLSAPP
jgi:DNA-binding transcriptional LysR family regulator